jgi:hypothetical protein
MNKNEEVFYISHIVRDELPRVGLSMLYFYTKKGDKYYWGLDNNSFSEEDMKNLEEKKQVIRLTEPLEIKQGKRKGLWTDSEGNVYVADIEKPYSDNLNPLENIILK